MKFRIDCPYCDSNQTGHVNRNDLWNKGRSYDSTEFIADKKSGCWKCKKSFRYTLHFKIDDIEYFKI